MNRMISIYLFLIVSIGVLIFSLVVRYGQSPSSQESETLQESNMLKLTSIKINDKSLDIGKIPISDEAKTEFVLHNIGMENLYIDRVEVSCQCTSGEVTKGAIAPGDSVPIMVSYNKKMEGYFFQDVLVYGNFDTSPEILSFEGYLVK